MFVTKIVKYAAIIALSFGTGAYGLHYYQGHKNDSYMVGIRPAGVKIEKHDGIDGIVDDLVDEARKKFEDGKKEVRRLIEEHTK